MKKLSFLFGLAMLIAAIFVSASGPVSAASHVTQKGNEPAPCSTCTVYGKFNIRVMADSTSLQRPPIAGAAVSVFKMPSVTTAPVAKGTTDASGNYSVALPAGNYMVRVSAIGYNNANQNFAIASSQTTQATSYLSVVTATTNVGDPSPCTNCDVAPGLFQITVRQMSPSLQKHAIEGANVSVYKWLSNNNVPVATGTTDADGNFSAALPAGKYTVVVSAIGYDNDKQKFVIAQSKTTQSTSFMSPTTGN